MAESWKAALQYCLLNEFIDIETNIENLWLGRKVLLFIYLSWYSYPTNLVTGVAQGVSRVHVPAVDLFFYLAVDRGVMMVEV